MKYRIYLEIVFGLLLVIHVRDYINCLVVPDDPCDSVNFITRDAIPLRAPAGGIGNGLQLITPIDTVITHQTGGSICLSQADCTASVIATQDYYMDDLGRRDIPYHFLIGGDGNVFEGRGWDRIAAHMAGRNEVTYGIGFIGSFENSAPVVAADTFRDLIACGQNLSYIQDSVTYEPHPSLSGELVTWTNDLN